MDNRETSGLHGSESESPELSLLFKDDSEQKKEDPSLRSKEDTVNLLKECNAGCKSATNSLEQVESYIQDEQLLKLIHKYDKKHIKIGDQCHLMLNKYNEEEKDPALMAKTFSWLSTNMKLMINDDSSKIAGIMIDGCVMGIKSVSGYLNQYTDASKESKMLAVEIVEMEKSFMNEMLRYL